MRTLGSGKVGSCRQAWREMLDPNVHMEISIVSPMPPRIEHNVAAHVILIQAHREDWVTSLVSVFDHHTGIEPTRIAITTIEHIHIEHLLVTCNYDPICTLANQPVQCHAWYDRIILQPGFPLQGRSGYSIVIQIHRQPIPQFSGQRHANIDQTSLLQISARTISRLLSILTRLCRFMGMRLSS